MRTPVRLILQPLSGDAPDVLVLRDTKGLYRVASLQPRLRVDDALADRGSTKPSARLRERRFQSLEDLEAALADELGTGESAPTSEKRRSPTGNGQRRADVIDKPRRPAATAARSKVTKIRTTDAPQQRHPQWLTPEMAEILEKNGYRHNVTGGFYFADENSLITETQLLVSEPGWLRKVIAGQRARSRRR